MSITGHIVVFVVLWWLVLFTLLPVGVKTPEEAGEEREPGTPASAPVRPRIAFKMLLTTAIAAALWLLYWLVVTYKLISLGG